MTVHEIRDHTNELLTVHHPFRCGGSACKCCCYKEVKVTSGYRTLGTVTEECYYCIPSFKVRLPDQTEVYHLHPPTCCMGACFDCCHEDCCLQYSCCVYPFHIFPAAQDNTDMSDYLGKILKRPRSVTDECCTRATVFDIDFPVEASPEEKGLLMGATILLNSTFFQNRGLLSE